MAPAEIPATAPNAIMHMSPAPWTLALCSTGNASVSSPLAAMMPKHHARPITVCPPVIPMNPSGGVNPAHNAPAAQSTPEKTSIG